MLGVVLLLVGPALSVAVVRVGLDEVRFIRSVDDDSASMVGVVRATDRGLVDDTALVSFLVPGAEGSVDTWVDVGSAHELEEGQRVRIVYDWESPHRAYLSGNAPDLEAILGYVALGAICSLVGLTLVVYVRRHQVDLRSSWTSWTRWTALAGVTTWTGFTSLGWKTGDARAYRSGLLYAAGGLVALGTLVGSILLPALEVVGLVAWMSVWLGGMAHAIYAVGRLRPSPPEEPARAAVGQPDVPVQCSVGVTGTPSEGCPSCGELLLVDAVRCPACDTDVIERSAHVPIAPPRPPMAPPPNPPRPAEEGMTSLPPPPPNPPSGDRSWRRHLRTKGARVVLYVLGLGIMAFAVTFLFEPFAESLDLRRTVASVDHNGVTVEGVLVSVVDDGWLAEGRVRFPVGGSSRTAAVRLGNSDGLREGQAVVVRYDATDPSQAYVLEHEVDYGLVVVGFAMAAGIAWVGIAVFLAARCQRRDVRFRDTGSAQSAAALGLATWIGFLYLAARTKRDRFRIWAAVYGLGALVVVVLLVAMLWWTGLEPVALAAWGTLWVIGMLHALFLVGRVQLPGRPASEPTEPLSAR